MKGKRFVVVLVSVALVSALLAALLGSCPAEDYQLRDGYYSAEAAVFDEYGWKEYVTVFVSNGQIVLVEYNAFNASGFIKSWDMSYMRVMNATDGTYPNAYTRYYGGRLVSVQGTDGISGLSGATHSYHTFMKLAEAALEQARQGHTETCLVTFGAN